MHQTPERPGSAVVVRAGALTTFQDAGRLGYAHLGVPRSGALDPAAFALANRLVGNPAPLPALETTFDGVALRFDQAATVAVTGAHGPVRVDGNQAGWALPLHIRPGATLDVRQADRGLRAYIAVAGGFAPVATLDSASTDQLSGLGPAPLRDGDQVEIGLPAGAPPVIDIAPYILPPSDSVIRLHPGPRRSWLTAQAEKALFSCRYTVTPTSNRVAVRLAGPTLDRSHDVELPSEGIVWGSVELLPSGQILIFLADHPTTGGYPVVAVADHAAAGSLAQARPGSELRFDAAGRWDAPVQPPPSTPDTKRPG